MDPDNSYTPPPNQYDFILNSQKQPSRKLGGGSQKQRILVVIIGLALLLSAILVFFTILGNSGRPTYDDSANIVTLQRKLLQASNTAISDSPSSDTRSRAATIRATITSDNQRMEAFLEKSGQKELLSSIPNKDTKIEQALQLATSNNNFDTVYDELVDELIADYISELRVANSNSKSRSEQDIIDASFQHIRTLLQAEAS